MTSALHWLPPWEIMMCDCEGHSSPQLPPGDASCSGRNRCIFMSSDQRIFRTSFRVWGWFRGGAHQHWKGPPRESKCCTIPWATDGTPCTPFSKHQQSKVGNWASIPDCLLKHHTSDLPPLICSNELSKKALWNYPREHCLIHKLRESEMKV